VTPRALSRREAQKVLAGRRVAPIVLRAFSAGLLLLTAPSALAQDVTSAVASSTPAQTVKLGSLEVTLNWRSRLESWQWFVGNSGDGDYAFGHSQLRVGLGHKSRRGEWLVEAEQVALLGLPTNAVAPAPLGQLGLGATYYVANGNADNAGGAFVKQAYVQLKPLCSTTLKIGRFEFFDGAEARSTDPTVTTLVQTRIAHRLISNFGFTAVQRTFDGAQVA
jgi:hypothetical protein